MEVRHSLWRLPGLPGLTVVAAGSYNSEGGFRVRGVRNCCAQGPKPAFPASKVKETVEMRPWAGSWLRAFEAYGLSGGLGGSGMILTEGLNAVCGWKGPGKSS
jgi:hypothetical protein